MAKGAVHLPASIPEKDLEALRAKVESVRRYVNMRVAHYDAGDLQRVPSYGDIDEALAFVLDLHRKYQVLLTGVSLHDEVILQPWEAIFYRSWIREGPATPETADRLAIRKFAKLSEGAKKELLRVLTAESRVRADVIRQLFDRPDTRDLAEVLMDLEGDELLRDSVVRLLPIMEDG